MPETTSEELIAVAVLPATADSLELRLRRKDLHIDVIVPRNGLVQLRARAGADAEGQPVRYGLPSDRLGELLHQLVRRVTGTPRQLSIPRINRENDKQDPFQLINEI